ncbi:hypothetical protein L915_17719 [Phytophthora nicotianae]|uniref:Uncharacterized protein n=1 Tax=Phytophthora nicotianae TaxID=4792 RepID=W2G0I4_PHYNI|nr:hypothetical protein L915_17719 [Phytophthora nicotianae]
MELTAWREAVSYGSYLQPIHLEVVGSNSESSFTPCIQELSSQSAQNSNDPSEKPAETLTNGTPISEQTPETSTASQTDQNTAQATVETVDVTVIPPFTCEGLNGGEQIALNVGGPVWAMDWLPSKPASNAATVAAALIKSKEKKPRRSSAASKKAQQAALKGKENNQVESADGNTTAASNSSADSQNGSKLEWRFLALATHPPCQVEDGKVVKNTPPDHYYDVPESARNLIQIWAVPVQPPETLTGKRGETEKKPVKPRLVYAIDHESGVAWDLQWCPLVKKFPKSPRRENILGILAACFGDGSVRVFEVPMIPEERLQLNIGKEQRLVDKNIPIVVAKLPRIMQLSVQWSPHTWNLLLTGGSDGSVSLWNIKSTVSESDSLGDERAEPEPIEPQRRFQDADTIGKQEAFDWGCGWVAIRAVAWSPFDEHLFATTGNDSVFKVWDVREPRVCLRSHRIRSTWGLALQWMDQTSIQISGDQGSVYMYDILSGSYQKLHFHPQIDSPVWDLQFARRGAVPLLLSSCTSGSIRAAPAKKLYRAPQNCVEICRLSGQKDSSIDKPFKSLRISFDKHSVLGSADSVSQTTREFCERDAALHRLRLSSITPGDYPCFLAAGGHAGLVILLEMQETLDTLISTFFMPPSKKTGRPKKIFATVGGHHVSKKKPSETAKGAAGRKGRTLGSFAKAKGMHTALSKYKKKALGNGKTKARYHANAKKKSFIQEDGEVEMDDSVEEEEEPEFEEVDEEEDESDLSLVMEDSSDDDRISVSDKSVEEEEAPANENPEEARLMKEYQLDLSEEDAILLAIQMSKESAKEKPTAPTVGPSDGLKPKTKSSNTGAKAGAAAKKRKTAAPRGRRRRSNSQLVSEEDAVQLAILMSKELLEEKQPAPDGNPASSDGLKPAKNSSSTESKVRSPTKKTATTPREQQSSDQHDAVVSEDAAPLPSGDGKQAVSAGKKTVKRSRSTGAKSRPAAKKRKITTAPQDVLRSSNDQGNNMSESIEEKQSTAPSTADSEASKEIPTSIRAEADADKKNAGRQQSSNVKGVPEDGSKVSKEPTTEASLVSANAAVSGTPNSSKPAKKSSNTVAKTKAKATPTKRKKTAISPRIGRRSNAQDDIVSEAIQISKELIEEKQPAGAATQADNNPTKRSSTRAKGRAAVKKRKKTATTPRPDPGEALAVQVFMEEEKQPVPPESESKKPAKSPSRTNSKAGTTKKRKKTATAPRGRRRSSNDFMSEEDALRLALTISELEY